MKRRIALLGGVLLLAGACSQTPAYPGPPTTTADDGTASGVMPPRDDPARVVVLGDFGADHPGLYEVAASLEALAEDEGFDTLVTVGDNFYTDDVATVWLEPYGFLARRDITLCRLGQPRHRHAGENRAGSRAPGATVLVVRRGSARRDADRSRFQPGRELRAA